MFFLKTCFVFAILYDLSFSFLPTITSGRVAVSIALLYILLSNRKVLFDRNDANYLTVLVGLLFISSFQCWFSQDYTQSSRLFFYLIYCFLTPILAGSLFKDFTQFLQLVLFSITVQSIILLISFLHPDFKDFISSLISINSNIELNYQYRAFGLTSSSGAALSIIQSIGVICGLTLLNFNSFRLRQLIIILSIILCLFSTIVTGRSGLIISVIIITIKAVYFGRFNPIKTVLSTSLVLLFALWFFSSLIDPVLENMDFNKNFFFEWVLQGFEIKNNRTYTVLSEMAIPNLTYETFLGTGQIALPNGLNASGHDSGFIQTYFSLGFIGSVIFYLGTLNYCWKNSSIISNRKARLWMILIFSIMFTIELKEPFMFKYVFPFFSITSMKLLQK